MEMTHSYIGMSSSDVDSRRRRFASSFRRFSSSLRRFAWSRKDMASRHSDIAPSRTHVSVRRTQVSLRRNLSVPVRIRRLHGKASWISTSSLAAVKRIRRRENRPRGVGGSPSTNNDST